MKAIFFYPLALISAGAMICLSLGPMLFPIGPASVAGAAYGRSLRFDAATLAHYQPSTTQYSYVSRDWLGPPTGLQIATKRAVRLPSPRREGLRIMLTPETAARLAGRPLHLRVAVKPMALGTTAAELAVSAQAEGPINWVSKPITTENGILEFDLPASAEPVKAIGLWPYSEAQTWWFDFGVEITQVSVSY